MDDTNAPAQWHISAFHVPRDGAGHEGLVGRVRELRARILYDHGRRPDFRADDGSHRDDQDLDYGAWHFVARRDPDGEPLGYIRLSTPVTGELFQSRAFLGDDEYRRVLRAEGVEPNAVFEHSRLVVEQRSRKLGLGVHLNAVAIGAAHHLGAEIMIGTSGTKDGQDRFHGRFGFEPVPGTRRYVERYTEDVVILVHRTARGAGEYADLVDIWSANFPALVATDGGAWISQQAESHPEPRALRTLGAGAIDSWRPVLFEPRYADDRAAFTALLESGQVTSLHDTIDTQLIELIRSREPHRRFTDIELADKVTEQLAGAAPWSYGAWAWYPWSGRLVHVLPREEFRLVRTDRNREKIQRPEQRRLLGRRIGVIGLSVGSSAAVTLALEGIGGAFRLADFDELSLSNMNRLRAGVHDLGVGKAVLCARQLYEIDPYLEVEILPAGLTDATMDQFFGGDGAPIDLLVEECDTPYIKLAAREYARAVGIPVVMDCNDRGMLDIERFDLEPDRPLLHGRLGDTRADELAGLTAAARAELILAMVDAERISPQLAAAFPEIGRTLSSWPQLASDVALGGALVTEAARRILLGEACESGRFYVDLAELITPERNTAAFAATL
ncbi:ThiF family adenylyltransferase [Nocardia sp. NBC_01503]|uniref:ThiF family adenylyltransferase n=1 Tax=Nocardia sp. NBC_01503 TaxID=2975997 RepID=UPI002E7C2CC7|nr:ThiF family adenylyltransferase [Nocardia sp. NBC_01503]WTL34859.1 ThiF family adenylyltransferase [Nocardia sp. NBC_01503]